MSATIKDPSSMEVFDRSLVDLYKAAKIGNVNARERNSMYILRNKKPEWDTDVNGYVLDFKVGSGTFRTFASLLSFMW